MFCITPAPSVFPLPTNLKLGKKIKEKIVNLQFFFKSIKNWLNLSLKI